MIPDRFSVSRTPGFLEKYFICMDTTGVLNRGFNITIRLNEPVSDVLLSNALRRVIVSCPYLTVNAFRASSMEQTQKSEVTQIENRNQCHPGTRTLRECSGSIAEDARADGMNYQIRPVDRILFSEAVFHKSVKIFDDSVLDDLSKIRIPVNREKAMWYLSNTTEESSGTQYLTFACNHVMFDGRSAVNFFEDLVKALDVVSRESCSEIAEVLFDSSNDCPRELPRPCEKVTNLYDSPIGFALSTIVSHLVIPKFVSKFFVSHFLRSSPNFYRYPLFKVAPFNGHNESKFRLLRFRPEEVRTILARCRQEKSTLTPMMASMLYRAIDSVFTPHLGDFCQSCEVIFCGRRYSPEEQDTRYGLFVSSFTPHILPGSTVAEAAQSLSEGLLSAMKSRRTFYMAGLLRLFNVWEYMKGFTENKEERHTFEISNLGRINVTAGKWRVTDAVFSQGVALAHITLSVISTPEGGMNISIAFHEKMADIYEEKGLAIDRCIEEFETSLLSA